MKRAKNPPLPDMIATATVIVDAIVEKRRDEFATELPTLMNVAKAEYLRQFPKARIGYKSYFERCEWFPRVPGEQLNGERHFCCIFCRESLNTLNARISWSNAFVLKMERGHIEECAMRFLAGLFEGVGPNGEPPKKDKPKKLRPAPAPKPPKPSREGNCLSCGTHVTTTRSITVCEPCAVAL